MDKKAYIQDNTGWLIYEKESGLKKIIDLYNTWTSWFFHASRIDGSWIRYQGTRGDFITSDTRKLGEYIVEYINNGYEETIGMIEFSDEIKCEKGGRFDIGYYKEPKGWVLNGCKHSVHLEHAFFKMSELFKAEGMLGWWNR
jgi:hypothetical protein